MVVLIGQEDGGLALRQSLRVVKDRMQSAAFRRDKRLRYGCGECIKAGAKTPRQLRTWSGMRSHLIVYHRMDGRLVPEE